MAEAKQYEVILTGESPLLLHRDNLEFSEVVKKWQKAPENKELSQAGDDRSPRLDVDRMPVHRQEDRGH